MNMVVPYLSVPVTAGLTFVQIIVCMVRDNFGITSLVLTREQV